MTRTVLRNGGLSRYQNAQPSIHLSESPPLRKRLSRTLFLCWFFFVAMAVIACGALSRAAEGANDPGALLTIGLKNSPAAVNKARDEYSRLKRGAPNDARIDYAFSLVLINQGRFRQAIPLIEGYLRSSADDLEATRILLHARMLDRNYAAALASAVSLADRLHNPIDKDDPGQRVATAELLGRTFGYLELRGAAAMSPDQLANAKNKVLARLNEEHLEVLDGGRQAALSLYHRVEAEREAKQANEKVADEDRLQQVQSAVASGRGAAVNQRSTAQQSSDQLRESQREYDILAKQLLPLLRDRTQLGLQIMVVQSDIIALVQTVQQRVDGGVLNARIPPPGTGFIEAAQVNTLSMSLASLNRQALDLDRRIMSLQTRAGELVAAGAKASEELADSTAALAKSEKRAKNLEKQLARAERKAAAKAAAAKAPAVTGRMAQFSTYAPFPYEQEKERVLSWYAK